MKTFTTLEELGNDGKSGRIYKRAMAGGQEDNNASFCEERRPGGCGDISELGNADDPRMYFASALRAPRN